GGIEARKRKVKPPASVFERLETEIPDSGLRVLHNVSHEATIAMAVISMRKILLPHPVERRTDQVAVGLKEPRGNPGSLAFYSLCPILEHAGILHGVLPGHAV